MTNEEKILQALENIQKDVKDLKQGQERLEKGQAQHKTALEVLGASLQDTREDIKTVQTTQKTLATAKDVDFTVEAAKREIQADINTVTAHVIRQVQSNTRRITALEEHTGAEKRYCQARSNRA